MNDGSVTTHGTTILQKGRLRNLVPNQQTVESRSEKDRYLIVSKLGSMWPSIIARKDSARLAAWYSVMLPVGTSFSIQLKKRQSATASRMWQFIKPVKKQVRTFECQHKLLRITFAPSPEDKSVQVKRLCDLKGEGSPSISTSFLTILVKAMGVGSMSFGLLPIACTRACEPRLENQKHFSPSASEEA